MATGTVKTYDPQAGVGWISPDKDGPDVFVHYSSFQGDIRRLDDGERVEFQLTQGSRGPQADRVFLK